MKLKQSEYQLADVILINYMGVDWFLKMVHFIVYYVLTFID